MRDERPPRRRRGRAIAGTAALVALLAAGPARGDPVRLRAEATKDGARVTLTWPAPVAVTADANGGRLFLRFDRPADGPFPVPRSLKSLIGSPARTDNGRTLVFPLGRGVTALAWPSGDDVVVEVARTGEAGAAAADPGNRARSEVGGDVGEEAGAEIGPVVAPVVRTGQHTGYSRVVFEWPSPVDYRTERAPGSFTVVFDRPAKIDSARLRPNRLKYVDAASVERSGKETRVTFRIDEGSDVQDRREGRKVVIDVLAPSPDFVPAAQPGAPPDAGRTTGATPGPTTGPTPEGPPQGAPHAEPPAQAPPRGPSGQEAAAPPRPAAAPATREAARPAARAMRTAVLRIPWDRPVAAAVFRRGTAVWCVFDQPSNRDTAALAKEAGDGIARIDQRPADRATILRIETATDLQPKAERDGFDWIVRFDPGTSFAGRSIVPVTDVPEGQPARVLLPVAEPGEPIAVHDPVSRETSVVVPVSEPGSRIEHAYAFPQFRLPETVQGIVVRPAIDTLRVRSVRDGVEIGTPGGLAVSPAIPDPRESATDRLLDPKDWRGPPVGQFPARRQALERAAADAPPAEREAARLRLAQFLLGNRFSVEALGVLQVAAKDRPALVTEPPFLLLRGAAELLAGRTAEARDDLGRAATGGSPEATAWAAAGRAAAGDPPGDLTDLPKWTSVARRYPPDLRAPLASRLAEAAIDGGRPRDAALLLDMAKAAASDDEMRGRLAFLEGRRREAVGDTEGALAAWNEAARIDPRRARAEAELARTKLLLRQKRITPADAIATLEGLQFTWRGDDLEFRVRRELGRLQLETKDYPAGLRTLKRAIADFPGLPAAKDAAADIVQAFHRLYLDGDADRLPPVTAIALYDEFEELTPPGEAGRMLVRAVADRLAAVDLLDRATALLEGLLPSTDAPAERAAIGARLAELRLQDGNATAAIDALRQTAAPDVPPDLRRRRALLEARALAISGQGDRALVVLGQDSSLDAELLRARILREKGEWAAVAETMRRIVDAARGSQADGTLDEAHARDVLDLAVALTLAGNDPQLSQLDREYRGAMARTPLKDAFRLLAGTIPPPDADPASLADLVERAAAFRRSLPSPEATPGPDAKPAAEGKPAP